VYEWHGDLLVSWAPQVALSMMAVVGCVELLALYLMTRAVKTYK
jgi:hypothetical protein